MTKILQRTWRLSLLALLLIVSNETFAWRGMRMPELFVKGRYLMAKDLNGNDSIVNLHGFGQTYSAYFNGYAWCKNADGSVNWGKTKDASACVAWNKNQIKNNKVDAVYYVCLALAVLIGACSGLYDKYLMRRYDHNAVQVYYTFYQALMFF